MTTQTIEVEGLPEGWKATEFRLGEINEPYFDPTTNSICRLLLGSTVGVLIVEKIQPRRRRIVLEVTNEERPVSFGDWYGDKDGTIGQWPDSEYGSEESYVIWREVKETDIPLTNEDPKLSLSVAECRELVEYGGFTKDKVWEFIKENS